MIDHDPRDHDPRDHGWGGPRHDGWGPPHGSVFGGGPGRRRWRARPPNPRKLGGAIGCLFLAIVFVIGLITALATWVAGTVLGFLDPGIRASAPTAFAVLVVIIVAFVIVARAFARVVGPLAAMANAADRLADGESGVRVETRGRGPVGQMASSFNAMADRLDRSRADRQALLADVTHELRTPLQVIAGNMEAMRDGVHPRDDEHLGAVLAETAVMDRLLDDLRTLSLAEAGALPLHREDVDLRRLLADVAAAHATAAGEAAVSLVTAGGAPLVMDLDPVRIREVVVNLVVNAIRHTPAGGTVTLAAARAPAPGATASDGAWVDITVTDTGEGLAAEDLERVFARFHRRADSGGSGLGLTIARDLVAAHGGTIVAESAGPGRGATFRVRLPARG